MSRSAWRPRAIAVFKAAVAVLVLWAVGRHVARTWGDLEGHDLFASARPGRLVLAGVMYLLGLSCSGVFYKRVLDASVSPIGLGPAVRAYLISHLGKYVPGKAMVVVMRVGLSVPFGARGATAAIATFYETLVMMAAGGLIAAAGFALAGPSHSMDEYVVLSRPVLGVGRLHLFQLASAISLGLGSLILFVVLPPVFRRLAHLVKSPFPVVSGAAIPVVSTGLLVEGLLWSAAAWMLLGLSQVQVVMAVRPMELPVLTHALPVIIAGVALATVGGFAVAVLPGGLGVREGILMYTMTPVLGDETAVVSALLLRLVWVAAEVVAGALLLPMGRGSRREPDPANQIDPS